jgi:large subunit ribosomal protein L17
MRHRIAGKRLGRTSSHRRAMRRNMAVSLFEHGAIRTTEVKAKELRRFVERLITAAKKGTLHARRRVIAEIGHDRDLFDREGERQEKSVVQKLFDEIAPRYEDRNGGYTRLIRLAERRIGDAGRQVILQLVEESTGERDAAAGPSRRRRRAARRHEAAGAVPGKGAGKAKHAETPEASDETAEPQAPTDDEAPDAEEKAQDDAEPPGQDEAPEEETDAAEGEEKKD